MVVEISCEYWGGTTISISDAADEAEEIEQKLSIQISPGLEEWARLKKKYACERLEDKTFTYQNGDLIPFNGRFEEGQNRGKVGINQVSKDMVYISSKGDVVSVIVSVCKSGNIISDNSILTNFKLQGDFQGNSFRCPVADFNGALFFKSDKYLGDMGYGTSVIATNLAGTAGPNCN